MDFYVAPEIPGIARSILKSVFGNNAELVSFRWADGGGLYNKVYCIETTEGSFILKIECENIFPSTRRFQIENEVEGSRLLKQAGVPCPSVLAHDFTKNETGVRFVLTECLSDDYPVIARFEQMDELTKAEVERQATDVFKRISKITNPYFGSLLPSGPLGWRETWGECYKFWFDLLINDCVSIGLFADDELAIVKAADDLPIAYSGNPVPNFSTEDLGWHNMIWGHSNGGADKLHVIDFGNSRYILPYINEYYAVNIEMLGRPPFAIPELRKLDKGYNLLLLYEFEGMLWKESEKLIEDYAHVRDWMAEGIERSKNDTSRGHIEAFVEKSRGAAQDS